MKHNPTLTIVTGSDFTHAKSLINFLRSANQHAPETKLIVYDLGMTPKQIQRITKIFNYEIRKFDYSKYPAYFNIKIAAGEYAWKPVIIAEVAKQYCGTVLWMDAGNMIIAPLLPIIDEALRTGFWRTSSGGFIGRWTHPLMLKYFNLPTDWNADVEMLAGGGVAFNTQNDKALKLLTDWAKHAQIKDCIAPEGSNRKNHRQDQALLSVLAAMQNWPTPQNQVSMPVVFHQDIESKYSPWRFTRRRIKSIWRWIVAR